MPSAENDRYGFLSSDGYPEEGPNPLIKPLPSAEKDAPPEPVECCASGRCEVCTPGYEWGGGYVTPPAEDRP